MAIKDVPGGQWPSEWSWARDISQAAVCRKLVRGKGRERRISNQNNPKNIHEQQPEHRNKYHGAVHLLVHVWCLEVQKCKLHPAHPKGRLAEVLRVDRQH